MKNRRLYKIGIVLSVVLIIGSLCLPESMGDTPALLMAIGLLCFVVFLIALIVSGIRAKKQAKQAPVSVAPVPSSPVATLTPTPSSAPAPLPSPKPSDKKALKIERVHVRGVNYYTKNIIAVGKENSDYSMTKQELAEYHEDERVYQYDFIVKGDLVPEPDNEHDPNAIMVQANGLCIGHVPAGSTAHIRKLMESGRIKRMELNIGGGKYKEVYEDEDGKYELEKGEKNFSAVLELYLRDEIGQEAE